MPPDNRQLAATPPLERDVSHRPVHARSVGVAVPGAEADVEDGRAVREAAHELRATPGLVVAGTSRRRRHLVHVQVLVPRGDEKPPGVFRGRRKAHRRDGVAGRRTGFEVGRRCWWEEAC